jgi:hypothetical protein
VCSIPHDLRDGTPAPGDESSGPGAGCSFATGEEICGRSLTKPLLTGNRRNSSAVLITGCFKGDETKMTINKGYLIAGLLIAFVLFVEIAAHA